MIIRKPNTCSLIHKPILRLADQPSARQMMFRPVGGSEAVHADDQHDSSTLKVKKKKIIAFFVCFNRSLDAGHRASSLRLHMLMLLLLLMFGETKTNGTSAMTRCDVTDRRFCFARPGNNSMTVICFYLDRLFGRLSRVSLTEPLIQCFLIT